MYMDIIENILIGLFVNNLSYIFGYAGGKLNNSMFEDEDYTKLLIKEIDFEPIIEEMLEEQDLGEIKIDDIGVFLKSPGVESIVRQIYATKIYPLRASGAEEKVSIEDIKEEFSLLLSQHIETKGKDISNLSSKVFNILITGCEMTLEKAANKGVLAAHEAESKCRFNLLFDQLEVVNKNIEFLAGKHKPDIREINKFVEKYCQVVKKRYETIRSASYNDIRPTIDEIYVCPNLIIEKEIKIEYEREGSSDPNSGFSTTQELISINQFLPNLYRAVLLGDPGAGKSTFAQKISHDIVIKNPEKISPGNCDVPIIVTLREYQIENLQNGISIIDFIKKDTRSNYQITVPNDTFEYLFLNGYILLIFDGLDELLDTRLRAKIVDEIESFCIVYPSVPILVTSRKVGYEEAPLRADMFQKIELAPFDDKQIEEYVNKWFSLDPDLACEEKEKKIKSFLRESEIVSDIRSNSLMLSLMCSIYREENYIPSNRPEVYKKCSEMLFEKWDKSRGISPSILVAKPRIRSLISYLAYIIFTNDSLQKGINENKLIDKATEYLLETLYENEYDAEEAAKDFINFCKGRAWILTDMGTTRWGENIYQFTHRTFLEYFTAEWIVRRYEESLCDVLLARICNGEWDNVSQLAFQIRYEKSEGGDKLFANLLKKLDEVTIKEKFNLLSFTSRCLGFIVPSPKMTREITTACFNFLINSKFELMSEKRKKQELNSQSPMELIYSLENSMPENRGVIGDTIENLIVNNICKGSKYEAVLSFEICLNLAKYFPLYSGYDTFRTKNEDFWKCVKINIIERCSDHTNQIIRSKLNCCIEFYCLNRISLMEVIDLHGISSIFSSYSFKIIPDLRFMGIYYKLLNSLIYNNQINIKDFEVIGRITLSQSKQPSKLKVRIEISQLHFLTRRLITSKYRLKNQSYNYITEISKNIPPVISLNQVYDSIFGAFCLLAYVFEILSDGSNKQKDMDEYATIEIIPTSILKTICASWLGMCDFNELNVELSKMKFTDKQRTFIEKWVTKEISLVEY